MLNSIEEAINEIRNGSVIIVVDDENRENEGDFICAAEKITPEIINFMATYGRGLICAPLSEARCEALRLDLMVGKNTALHATPFTISVDLIGHGCTTGISASDRAKTIKALVDPDTLPEDLARPGHIFPLKAKSGGVLQRTGHTEAAIDFPRLAGLSPAGVLVEIMNKDGSMARLPDLRKVADEFDLKLVSIDDLIKYRLERESLIKPVIELNLPTMYGEFKLVAYQQINKNIIHYAFVKGQWTENEPVLARVHAANFYGDVFGAIQSGYAGHLQIAMKMIANEGKGLVLYMNRDEKPESLLAELVAFKEARLNEKNHIAQVATMDERDFGIGAQILRDLNARKLKLITNHPQKRVGLIGYGLEIIENIVLEVN